MDTSPQHQSQSQSQPQPSESPFSSQALQDPTTLTPPPPPPPSPTKLTLLTLPPELRLQIFSHLRHLTQRPPIKAPHPPPYFTLLTIPEPLPRLHVSGYVAYSHSYINIPYEPKPRLASSMHPEPVLCTVRAVCRQLYEETREFIWYPRLCVRVYVDGEQVRSLRRPCGGIDIEGAMKELNISFVRENTVEVELCVDCPASTLFRKTLRRVDDVPPGEVGEVSVYGTWLHGMSEVLSWIWGGGRKRIGKEGKEEKKGKGKLFSRFEMLGEVIEILNTFPNLDNVYTITSKERIWNSKLDLDEISKEVKSRKGW